LGLEKEIVEDKWRDRKDWNKGSDLSQKRAVKRGQNRRIERQRRKVVS
jgi:hypothetical protein